MSDSDDEPPPLSKAARNERIKMLATSFNTIGLAVFGLGVLTPALTADLTDGSAFRFILGTTMLVTFHAVARYSLRFLED